MTYVSVSYARESIARRALREWSSHLQRTWIVGLGLDCLAVVDERGQVAAFAWELTASQPFEYTGSLWKATLDASILTPGMHYSVCTDLDGENTTMPFGDAMGFAGVYISGVLPSLATTACWHSCDRRRKGATGGSDPVMVAHILLCFVQMRVVVMQMML